MPLIPTFGTTLLNFYEFLITSNNVMREFWHLRYFIRAYFRKAGLACSTNKALFSKFMAIQT